MKVYSIKEQFIVAPQEISVRLPSLEQHCHPESRVLTSGRKV